MGVKNLVIQANHIFGNGKINPLKSLKNNLAERMFLRNGF